MEPAEDNEYGYTFEIGSELDCDQQVLFEQNVYVVQFLYEK
nr:hypothetical protein [Oceanobacillus alkalisoli]